MDEHVEVGVGFNGIKHLETNMLIYFGNNLLYSFLAHYLIWYGVLVLLAIMVIVCTTLGVSPRCSVRLNIFLWNLLESEH